MAEVSKTAKRSLGEKVTQKRFCTACRTGMAEVVKYVGHGALRGFRWTCVGSDKSKPCGFTEPTQRG